MLKNIILIFILRAIPELTMGPWWKARLGGGGSENFIKIKPAHVKIIYCEWWGTGKNAFHSCFLETQYTLTITKYSIF